MKKRLKVSLPKIGIRPIIDGRRNGVRESLEDQTMNMAKAVEKLIIENLRYPSGEVVECVIADSTIGGVSEATSCAEKFAKEGVGVTISVTPCWCYGSETIDMIPLLQKQFGALMQLKDQVQYILQQRLLDTIKRDYLLLEFTVTMFKIRIIQKFLKMLKSSCYNLREQDFQLL